MVCYMRQGPARHTPQAQTHSLKKEICLGAGTTPPSLPPVFLSFILFYNSNV